MAADFSTRATSIDSQIVPAATPLEPVTRQGEINALQTIGQGISAGAKTVGSIFRANAEGKANKTIADFSLRLNSLQDAQDQGLSAAEVRTRSRALLSQYLANDPNQEETYLKRYSTWLNQSGVDKVLSPDVAKAQIEQAQTESAVKAGFLSADQVGNPQAEEKAVSDLENFQRQTTQLEIDAKKVNAQSARLDLTAKQKEAIKAEGETKVLDGLTKVGQAALPYWRTQYENIKAAAAKAPSEQERQKIIKDGIMQLQTDYAQRTAALSGDGLSTNQAKIDQILKPQKDLIDAYTKELDGTYDTEMFKRMSDGAMARAESAALGKLSPKALEWLTLSKSSQGLSGVLAQPIATEIAEAYGRNAAAANESDNTGVGADQLTPSPNRTKPVDPLASGDDVKPVKAYLDSITTLLDAKFKGKYDGLMAEDKVQLDKEIDGQMKSIFNGVKVYSNSVESAKEFQPIIDFLSNPTVGQYLQERGGIPDSIRGEVGQVIQDGYDKQVVPLLKEELATLYNDKPGHGVGQTMSPAELRPASELVEPSFENNRFGFKLKEGVEPNLFNNLLLKKMNNSAFSKVFNKMVISNSHIQGNTDYQKSYDEIAPEVFGANSTGGPDERSQNTDGNIKDFTEEDAVIQPASFVPAEDNPDLNQEVLQRFEGRRLPVSIRNNNMGAISITGDVSSSWAAKQPGFVGVSKRPKAEGGYYAAYARPEDGVAAASNLLIRYGEKGTNTPSKIVKKWSADTGAHAAYARTLVKFLNEAGYDTDTTTELDLNDPNVRMAILKAKSAHESGAGKQVYSDAVFQKGVLGESV
jgi:hypothetical protein